MFRRVTAVVAAITMLTATPALAHTQQEFDEWMVSWQATIDPLTGMTPEHVDAYVDMAERHHCLVEYCAPPPPKKTAPVASQTYSAGVEQWRGLVTAYWPEGTVDRALRIMNCESRGIPTAKNPNSSARGLFQIMASVWADHFGVSYDALYDPETNIRLGAKILAQQGWGAWVCK